MEHYEVIIHTSARADILNAVKYVSKTLLEPATAHDLLLRFQKEILSLSDMPERYPVVPDKYLASYGLRMTSVGNYLVFFVVRKNERKVDVVRAIYGKRNWIELIKQDM